MVSLPATCFKTLVLWHCWLPFQISCPVLFPSSKPQFCLGIRCFRRGLGGGEWREVKLIMVSGQWDVNGCQQREFWRKKNAFSPSPSSSSLKASSSDVFATSNSLQPGWDWSAGTLRVDQNRISITEEVLELLNKFTWSCPASQSFEKWKNKWSFIV